MPEANGRNDPLRRRAGSSVRRKSLILELMADTGHPMSHSSMLQRIPLEHPFYSFLRSPGTRKISSATVAPRPSSSRRRRQARSMRCRGAGDGLGHMAPAAEATAAGTWRSTRKRRITGRFFRLCLVAPGTPAGACGCRVRANRDIHRGAGVRGAGVEAIAAIEEEALAHMNRDHRDAVQLYATSLPGQPPAIGRWRRSIATVLPWWRAVEARGSPSIALSQMRLSFARRSRKWPIAHGIQVFVDPHGGIQ